MGYGDGIADPMEFANAAGRGLALGETFSARENADQAVKRAYEWKNHADKLKLELKESMASQWNLVNQREAWKDVVRDLQQKFAPHLSKEEIVAIYKQMKQEHDNKNPIPASFK